MSENTVGYQDRIGRANTMHRTIVETTLSKFVDLDDFTDECLNVFINAYGRADEANRSSFGLPDVAEIILELSDRRPELLASGGPGAEQTLRDFISGQSDDENAASDASPRIDVDLTAFVQNCHTACAEVGGPVGIKDVAEALLMIAAQENTIIEMLSNDGVDEAEIRRQVRAAEAGRDAPRAPAEGVASPPFCSLVTGGPRSIVSRERELRQITHALSLHTRNCVCLVGPSGTGKSTIIEDLSRRMQAGSIGGALARSSIFALDTNALLAGSHMRGELEDRIGRLIAWFTDNRDAILLVEDLHQALSNRSGGNGELVNALRPLIARGTLRIIGTTTEADWRKYVATDGVLSRRFRRIDIESTPADQTRAILQITSVDLAAHHGVGYNTRAIDAAIAMPARYIAKRSQPDIGIELLDEAGALRRSRNEEENTPSRVSEGDVREVVSAMTGIPVTRLEANQKAFLEALPGLLKGDVIGQVEAVDHVCKAVRRSRSGILARKGPEGSYLFIGPTGCGKTSLAQSLARHTGRKLLRFDMSEYIEQHSVSRLIGAPPGYVGHDRGGLLTDAVDRHPNAIVLLDEIEKAHPSVMALLLQVMDAGRITDSRGETVDFRNALVIMSTNAGMQAFHDDRQRIGFAEPNAKGRDDYDRNAVATTFTAEFRNRLDAEIYFMPLSMEMMPDVVHASLSAMQRNLTLDGLRLEFDASAIDWLARKGYDPVKGARPLQRLIELEIVDRIATHHIETGEHSFALKFFSDESGIKHQVL